MNRSFSRQDETYAQLRQPGRTPRAAALADVRQPTPDSQADTALALLLPTPSGWRASAVGERLVLGGDSGPGRLSGPGVVPRHCSVATTPAGLRLLPGNGPVQRSSGLDPAEPLQPGEVLRLCRVPVVVVAHRQTPWGPWFGLGALGSWSPALWPVLAELALVASSPWPALLLGESGTGKELAARALHQASSRRHGPWVSVNCGALHGDLLLAELFGAEKGAYTGCHERRRGAFERADGGTLLLDELGELPAAAQAALLRVLEVGEVQVLGGPTRKVDVRLVCATHRDLHQLVAKGQFRLDLLHRVAVGTLRLPALRERGEDLAPLMAGWLGVEAVRPAVVERLQGHGWPGNLRELRNLAHRLQVTSRWGSPSEQEVAHALAELAPGCRAASPPASLRLQAVRDLVAQGLRPQQAWRHSGMSRASFYRLLRDVRAEAPAA